MKQKRSSKQPSENINWGIWLSLCVVHWIFYLLFARCTFFQRSFCPSISLAAFTQNESTKTKTYGNKNYSNVKSQRMQYEGKEKQKLKIRLRAFVATVCGSINPLSIFNLHHFFALCVFSFGPLKCISIIRYKFRWKTPKWNENVQSVVEVSTFSFRID